MLQQMLTVHQPIVLTAPMELFLMIKAYTVVYRNLLLSVKISTQARGSVVLTDVPAYTTAVGVPAKIVGKVTSPEPSRQMDHSVGEDGDAI